MVMASRDSESGNRWVVRGGYSGSILPAMHREPWSPTDEWVDIISIQTMDLSVIWDGLLMWFWSTIIYFEIQNSEFEFTFFHAQRNLSYLVFLLLVRSGMSLFMAVEETGSLMGVDIQSVADDVLEKWMEVVCSVAEMRPLLRLSAYRSGLFYEGKQWRCSIPQACLVFLSREMTFSWTVGTSPNIQLDVEPGNPECLSAADRIWRIALWPVSIRKVKS